jgi:hypothetical protein
LSVVLDKTNLGGVVKFKDNFRSILKLALIGLSAFASFSSTYIIIYISIDYQKYLAAYQAFQTEELEIIKNKSKKALGDLKKLLQLTEARIHSTHGNFQKIQKILNFLHRFQVYQALPEFQKVSYNKLSFPQMTVTRFGTLPLDPDKVKLGNTLSRSKQPMFVFSDRIVKGTLGILNFQNSIEGILEIEIDWAAFKKYLGTYETVDLSLGQFLSPKNTQTSTASFSIPFSFYRKPPDLFSVYVLARKSQYAIFAFYTFFVLIFIVFYLYFLDLRFQKSYRWKLGNLEDALFEIRMIEKSLRQELGIYQRASEIHQVSCQAQRKLQASLKRRQEEQASRLHLAFKDIQQSLENSAIQYGDTQMMEILRTRFQLANSLLDGVWMPIIKEEVDFKGILDNFQLIFAEKIHKLNIKIEKTIATETNPFLGDPLLIEIILINAIGKPLHRLPENGVISISLNKISDFLHLEIQDNGYAGIEAAEKFILKSFGFFMKEETFHQTCLDNGVRYQYEKADGLNITHLILPPPEEEALNSNVVQLFS